MNQENTVRRLLERYGEPVQLEQGEEIQRVKAFVQPLRYKNKMYLNGRYLPPGFADGGHYLYIGPSGGRLDLLPFDAVVRTKERAYTVKRAEACRLGEEILYIWAILQRLEEEPDGKL